MSTVQELDCLRIQINLSADGPKKAGDCQFWGGVIQRDDPAFVSELDHPLDCEGLSSYSMFSKSLKVCNEQQDGNDEIWISLEHGGEALRHVDHALGHIFVSLMWLARCNNFFCCLRLVIQRVWVPKTGLICHTSQQQNSSALICPG